MASLQLGAGFGQSGGRWGNTGGKHSGQDFRVPEGTNVYTPVNGKVTQVRDLGGKSYGRYIVVRGDDGRDYYFAHLSRQDVGIGDGIAAGTRIGLSGGTGNATGPHLHVEVRENGHAVDPLPYLKGHPPVAGDHPGQQGGQTETSLRAMLSRVGFKGDALDTAVAVAMAESGGNPNAHNGNRATGDNSYGLFQINMLGGMGPERLKQYGLKSNDDLLDPETNAKVAFEMSHGGKDWQPWSTYKTGAYKQYLGKDATITGTADAPAGGGVATTLNPDELAARYGYAASFFAQDPELKNLLEQATREQWTPEEFGNRLKNSKWYQSHGAKDREWSSLKATDPTEAKRQQQLREQEIKATARSLGVTLDPKRAAAMTEDSLRFGWDQQTIQRAVSDEYKYQPGKAATGKASTTVADLKGLAASYLVPISDGRLQDWTRRVISGETSVEDYKAYIERQASSLFPDLAGQIQSGQTVKDYLDPYEQVAAQTLGINPSEVDWLDPKWQQAVFRTDGTAKRTVMSLADWTKTLRSDPQYGYDRTSGAVQAATQLGSAVAQAFGNQG